MVSSNFSPDTRPVHGVDVTDKLSHEYFSKELLGDQELDNAAQQLPNNQEESSSDQEAFKRFRPDIRSWVKTFSSDQEQLKAPGSTLFDSNIINPPDSEMKDAQMIKSITWLFVAVALLLSTVLLLNFFTSVMSMSSPFAEERQRIAAEESEQRAALARWKAEEVAAEVMWTEVQEEAIGNVVLSSIAGSSGILALQGLWITFRE